MIILKTGKGWTGVKELNSQKVEGTIIAHQVVAPNARKDPTELKAIEDWLKSYDFGKFFDPKKGFSKDLFEILPSEKERVGNNKYLDVKKIYQPLKLPEQKSLEKELGEPGQKDSTSMRLAGEFLKEVFKLNKKDKNFRLMSPDETYSNSLDAVFEETSRAFVWPHKDGDKHMSMDGRVMEMLSEHNLHGLAQGYILTGRHSVFATYEAFAQIISSMAHQYIKFIKMAQLTGWRGQVSSMNYMFSSVAWRQEHNGFSHQNPSFISGMLDKHGCFVKVYFPADDNSMLALLPEVMNSVNGVNTIVAGKSPEPRWVTLNQANKAMKDGIATWDFASDKNPDVVVVGVGDYMTKESLAAIKLIKQFSPIIQTRFVNICRLQAKCNCTGKKHEQIPNATKYLTEDKPVIVNFHGYPEAMKAILLDLPNPQRFTVHGYEDRGGTTTPFDLLVRNGVSRFHIAIDILKQGEHLIGKSKARRLIKKFETEILNHTKFVIKEGYDPAEIENWRWSDKEIVTLTPDEQIQSDILKHTKTIAVVGLSDDTNRPSYRVASFLKQQGFRIIPVNPNVKSVLNEKAYPSITKIPKSIKVDIVDVFRNPENVIPHIKEVVERTDIKTVWLPEGVASKEAEDFAASYNLTLVSNFCIMESYKKLEQTT